MIAPAKQVRRRKSPPAWHQQFLAMLSAIVLHARIAFRHLDPEAEQEAVQEVVANCLVAFCRLAQLGKADLAYPGVLARYGVAQVRVGRRVGSRLRIGEVLSSYCQRLKGVVVQRLDHYNREEGVWLEVLVEDKNATPADLAASRIDFPAWLDTLSRRDRKVALKLAAGHTTREVAERFSVSEGRISQLRRELHDSWGAFHGERPHTAIAAAGA